MKRISKRGKAQTASGFHDVFPAWYRAKEPVLLYTGKFAGFLLFFCLLTLTPAYQSLLEKEAVWNAKLAHGILSGMAGGASAVSGATLLRGEEAILEVKTKCSGLYFCWLLCSAVLAFPAPMRWRMVGAVLGSGILMGFNILRVTSLFLIGCYYPGWFSAAHEQFWPGFSLVMTVILMGGWILWVKGPVKGEQP